MSCCSRTDIIGGKSLHILIIAWSLIECPESSAFILVLYRIQCSNLHAFQAWGSIFLRPRLWPICLHGGKWQDIWFVHAFCEYQWMRTKHTGFTISLVEWEPTITTLWATVKGITIYASSLQHSWLFIAQNSSLCTLNTYKRRTLWHTFRTMMEIHITYVIVWISVYFPRRS
jgi:hypothetical protein